ncbi:hypothetical protein KUCAC02_024523 [Chaenocephalus aceratus]|uniref:Uncharacterized protein n=1 Tax=Chaenocephalus aceratus TaxID=36190 RepID=A0ACB9WJ82_CHAAC|nr:hypothetical protein KUCAC02_024523 [Chaenocephalus aceratus]
MTSFVVMTTSPCDRPSVRNNCGDRSFGVEELASGCPVYVAGDDAEAQGIDNGKAVGDSVVEKVTKFQRGVLDITRRAASQLAASTISPAETGPRTSAAVMENSPLEWPTEGGFVDSPGSVAERSPVGEFRKRGLH